MSEHMYIWIDKANPLLLVLIRLVAFIIHFLPSFIAFFRDTQNRFLILVFNILLGWMEILWVVLLVWSRRDEHVKRSVTGGR